MNIWKKPNSIRGYHRIDRIEWQEKELIPNGPYSMHLNRLQGCDPMAFEPERPYCFTEILERDDNRDDCWGSEHFAITFLCADGIATYLQLFCGEYKKAPWLVLLQDHGFGCNYDKFGKGSILDEIIEKTGVKSQYVLCANNTHIWDGYTKIEDIPPVSGGMTRHLIFLYKLSDHTTDNV